MDKVKILKGEHRSDYFLDPDLQPGIRVIFLRTTLG